MKKSVSNDRGLVEIYIDRQRKKLLEVEQLLEKKKNEWNVAGSGREPSKGTEL